MKRVIAIFLKHPTPGRVKTRLAAALGEEGAAEAYRKLVCRVFEQCRHANPDVVAICYDPKEKEQDIRKWLTPLLAVFPGEVSWILQSSGDLGDRLEQGTKAIYRQFHNAKLAIIGTDCVGLDKAIFAEVWDELETNHDVVFGPTHDGGYYLVAMNCEQPALFQNIPWSSEETLAASIAAAESANLTHHRLPTLTDVDTIDEWSQVEPGLNPRPCIFFDRDGVVNRSPGPGYVLRREDFHLNPGIAESLQVAKENGFLAIIITSQKGVGKGLMTDETLSLIHQDLQNELNKSGVAFDGIYAFTGTEDCPHKAKPDPEMIFSAGKDFFLDLSRSWMIGDADRDIEMGQAANTAGTIRVVADKEVTTESTHFITETTDLPNLLKKIL